MDFSEPEKVRSIRGIIREFMRREVYPLEPRFRGQSFASLLPELRAAREKAKQTGLFAAHIPEALGGGGLSLTEFAHMSEELGRSPIGHYIFNVQAPDVGNMEILMEHGTEEQKERFLMPLVRGEIRSCFTMTEPEFAGSNPVWMGTVARKEGDEWVIRGHKWFASSVDGAAFAICMAVTEPDAPSPYQRASMIIVPTDTPGFEHIGNISVMGDRGSDYASHAEVSYQGCRVPRSNLLGQEGMGFVIAQDRLGPGRIHHCMRWIGVCERAFDIMCQHAAERELSPGRPLGTRQIVQEWIARSRAEINAARLTVLHAAWMIDHEGAHAARDEISLIKFTVAQTLQKVLDRAIQTLGALGMTNDTPLAWWYAHERGARIYDGPDEVHITAVARRILREYGIEVGTSKRDDGSRAAATKTTGKPVKGTRPSTSRYGDFADEPGEVREGERVDAEALRAFLEPHLPETDGEVTIEQFQRGHSNLTYLVRVGGRELVLRRPPFGAAIKTAHDMHREFTILTALRDVYPKVPQPIAYCDDESVIGAPFYVMERARGVILRGNRPKKGLDLGPEVMRDLSTMLIDNLAELHAVDIEGTTLADLGKPEGYVERQVTGWTRRYFNAKTDEVPTVEAAAAWLADNRPPERGATLIHNDYKYDNLVLHPDELTRIVAVLDWEMATVGDPLMDLGTTLGYWVDQNDSDQIKMLPVGPTMLPGNLTRAELVERYAEQTGRDISADSSLFYYVFGLFKVAVIAQQIYKRFKEGFTKDPRFGMLILGVRLLGDQASRALDRGRISDLH